MSEQKDRIFQQFTDLGKWIVELEETIAQIKSINISIQELRSIFAGFANGLQQGLALVQDGNILWANDAACKMVGYEVEEVINTSVIAMAPSDHREKLAVRLNEIQAGDVLDTYDAWPLMTKNRVVKQIKAYADRIIYNGKPAVLTILVDVTKEQALQDALSLRADMLDLVSDWIYLLDIKGNITYANKAMYESLGYTLDEITGKNIVDISAKEYQDKTRMRLQDAIKKGEGRKRTVYLSKSRKKLPMFVRGKVIKRGGQEFIFAEARELVREDEMGESLGDAYEL